MSRVTAGAAGGAALAGALVLALAGCGAEPATPAAFTPPPPPPAAAPPAAPGDPAGPAPGAANPGDVNPGAASPGAASPDAPAPGARAGGTAGTAPVTDPRQALGDAHQDALALVALGGLTDGAGPQVRELAPALQKQGRELDAQIRRLATRAGVALPDDLSSRTQSQLEELQSATGSERDRGWLAAARDRVHALDDRAASVRTTPGVPPAVIAQLSGDIERLHQLGTRIDGAAAAPPAGGGG
ncbi:DUF4142 domain-containing protein [Pseudonocardia phyllosphaerae]|uniref:DUF4142 domain-containing protein n=1 Tax=Pseudonocardia phyllosphaerae TaxID=3390502 RepID=UPI00397C7229